ncbi:hypothetical protein QOZ80_3AG0244140 [Eleusine coracana subsp. coracana]|nr:hypothetical protein QOZ80_3AG0244140 [Eleusine coracana subsp. coracana]
MDPHPTPFAGKRRTVPAPAAAAGKAAAPKPKSIAAVRTTRMAKKSPTGNANAAPQPRPTRRAFGTARSSNAPVEKPQPKLQKPSKVSPPPPQKPVKVSPLPLQKHSKLSPPAMQKPSKLSPTNPVRATKPSRPVAKPLKKTAPGADLEAKAKKRGQRVSFQVAAVESAAPGSREKVKAAADDAAGHTPMVATKASEKPSKVVAETPFFSAQNCSSCTLDQLESAAYWLAQIRLAESVGKHWVAAAFFRLAFECQAQPIHRIQSELRNYLVRHGSASTVAPLFDELLTAHGMLVNQPRFDTDGFEKEDTLLATKEVDKMLDSAKLKEDECLKRDCDDDPVDVGVVIVDKPGVERDCDDDPVDVGAVIVDKPGVESVEYPSFERKLNESLEFDDCNAVIVGRIDEASFDLQNNVDVKVPFSSGIIQSEYRSSIETPRGSTIHTSGRLSLDNPFDKKSPLLSKRLTSTCPPYKKSVSVRDQSSKRVPSGIHSEHQSKITQDMGSEHLSLFDQFESEGHVEDTVNNEIH